MKQSLIHIALPTIHRYHVHNVPKGCIFAHHFGAESQIPMLTESQLNQFQENGYLILDDFLPHPTSMALSAENDSLRMQSLMKQATIGKAESNQVNVAERGDFIHWVDPQKCSVSVYDFLAAMEELRSELNRYFYLGIRDFECHFTQYPAGTHYKRHVDRHKNGSSRRVSAVFYLNENWQVEHGGALMLYIENQEHRIAPLFGRLALFLSEIEHEVLPTHQTRKSLTGWMLTETIL